jgi:hypothetical protein
MRRPGKEELREIGLAILEVVIERACEVHKHVLDGGPVARLRSKPDLGLRIGHLPRYAPRARLASHAYEGRNHSAMLVADPVGIRRDSEHGLLPKVREQAKSDFQVVSHADPPPGG